MAPIHLYHFPGSYYSQKVLLALEEKEVEYKETIMMLMDGEVYEPWFVRLNPKGQVPMLRVENKCISESEIIIEVVDKLGDEGPYLVPDPKSLIGQIVEIWRAKLHALDIERLTYGILLNPELSESGFPELLTKVRSKLTKEEYMANMDRNLEKFEAYKLKYPDLRGAYDAKIRSRRLIKTMYEKADIVALKDKYEGLFDSIESQLMACRNGNVPDYWLCGPIYTAADITLCVLLGRLRMLGLLDRYLDKQKRPALVDYWNKAMKRSSVEKVVLQSLERSVEVMKKRVMKKVATGALVACGVVALGIFIGHKFKS